MRYRDAVLEYQKVLDNAGTFIKDLDITDPVTALYLEFEATNETTSNEDNFISDIITKLEIVDGSDVLYGLTLTELEALHLYKLGKVPTLFPSEWASGVQRHGCLLLFGRYLGDQEYAMDFNRFKNPQLKITTNIAAIRAIGSNVSFATGTIKGSIIAKIMEEAPTPAQYLMAKELLSFTSSSSSGAEERKELPLDYVYRMMMTRHWVEGSDIDEVTSNLKLTCDTDKFIALNRRVKQLDAEAQAMFGEVMLKHDFFRGGSFTARTLCNKEPWVTGFVKTPGTPRVIVPWAQWSSTYNGELYTMAGALDGTARQITGKETGHALHATLPIIMGELNKPETWFNPMPYKKAELVFTSGGTAGACAVVAEQVRPL